MKSFFFSSSSWVGLDLQPDGIRLVQLKKIRRTLLAEQVAFKPLPASVFTQGKIQHFDWLATALTELVAYCKLNNHRAAIHLPANLVRMRHVQLPLGLSRIEIENEIKAQIQRELPDHTDGICLDFTPLSSPKNTAYIEVFVAATRKAYLMQYVNCVNAAGLKVKWVDVDIYALTRAVRCNLQLRPLTHETHGIVYFAQETALFMVFTHQEIIFHQQWDKLDLPDFLAQLKQTLQLYFSTFRQMDLSHLAVCSHPDYSQAIIHSLEAGSSFHIHYPHPFQNIRLGPSVDVESAIMKTGSFFAAVGAALHEVP